MVGYVPGNVGLRDENGAAYGVKHIGNKPRVSAEPYGWDIAEGSVSGHTTLHVLGYNPDVDAVTETLWPVGGMYVFPTAGMGMEVVSGSTDDSSGGTGIRTVEIHYLDTGYAEQEEIVVMNGTTVRPTVATDILRIQEAHAESVGSIGFAAGAIDVRHLDDTPVYSRISSGGSAALEAIWTVPAANTLYITSWTGGVGSALGNRFARFILEATSDIHGTLRAGVFNPFDIIAIQDNMAQVQFMLPLSIPAQADVKMSVVSDASNANALCAGHFQGWYETT